MEELIHYVWKHKIFPLAPLVTTQGQQVEVIDPGLANPHAGPDFFNAKLKLDGTLWVGNVEVHQLASDWMRHGHEEDAAYNNVVLHVVGEADVEVRRADGTLLPQLLLPVPEHVASRYDELRRIDHFPPCYQVVPHLSSLTIHAWLAALQVERLSQKTEALQQRLQQLTGHWEDAFFVTLARNFGFGVNGETFEQWAMRLPFRAIDKHRDNLFQLEALFLGTAGLLNETLSEPDDYYRSLQKEFRYLSHKFSLEVHPLQPAWRFLRLRPSNFPHVRLAQLAALCHHRESLFSQAMESATTGDTRRLFVASPSPYWEEHYHFRTRSPRSTKELSRGSLDLLLINTVVPFLYAYGRHKADERLCERAMAFLEELKPEHNYVTRMWAAAGLTAEHAADSQALVQLQKCYCDRRDCLRCRFGFEYLRGRKEP